MLLSLKRGYEMRSGQVGEAALDEFAVEEFVRVTLCTP
jgi:hypothetical protein